MFKFKQLTFALLRQLPRVSQEISTQLIRTRMCSQIATKNYPPNVKLYENAFISNRKAYKGLYEKSIENPSKFWGKIAEKFYWKDLPSNTDQAQWFQYNLDIRKGRIFIKWMEGATTNISYNLLDRNIERGLGDTVAFYWEGNHPCDSATLTYKQLLTQVCKFANVLKAHGIEKGDRVSIYLPMILELPIAMLACARIGAIHSIVFAGFSSDSLAERLVDCQSKILITSDGVWRGSKPLHLKDICDEAIEKAGISGHHINKCIVVGHSKRVLPGDEIKVQEFDRIGWSSNRDLWWHEEILQADSSCDPEWVDSEHPLFLLYTSGSTGKPKGVLHTTGGYMIYGAESFRLVFDYKQGEIFWSSADIGWITGHTYSVYGPLANGASVVLFEGVPYFPEYDRFWRIIDKYQVNQFYTAPTAVRSLMKYGLDPIESHCLNSLKVLGTVGEPINPEAWLWFYKNIGKSRCSIVDTYWQTETGGIVLTPLPGATLMKPGSAANPFFGVKPILLSDDGIEIDGIGEGNLVFKHPWPGMMRSLYNNHDRFESTYFTKYPGYYFTGDGARRDSDGYIWITGRVDDMLNISGHLLPTTKIEAVITEHIAVVEAAVVAAPHPIKGECLHCFITPKDNVIFDESLISKLKELVRFRIGAFAVPDIFQYTPNLPKTRSGKIMRRILRKVALNDRNVGDVSTLATDGVVEELFQNKPNSENKQLEVKSKL